MVGQQRSGVPRSSTPRPHDEDGAALTDAAGVGPDPTGPALWPAGSLWIRIVGVIVLLAAIGSGGMLAASWPRQTAGVVGVVDSSAPPAPVVGTPSVSLDPAVPEPGSAAESGSAAEPLLVHITGDVRRPGVVRLPAGSRVEDAVEAAGGMRRGGDVGGTNLARLLVDGERIDVGGAASAQVTTADPSVGSGSVPVDLNTATAAQLDELPGIGPVTAAKIVAWRAANGRFTIVDELLEVSGIGPATLAELRPHVRV